MPQRQLNIRSDGAAARATRRAKRLPTIYNGGDFALTDIAPALSR